MTQIHRINGRTTECTRCGDVLVTEAIPGSKVRQTLTLGFALKSVEETIAATEKKMFPRIRLCNPCGAEFRKFMGEGWGEL